MHKMGTLEMFYLQGRSFISPVYRRLDGPQNVSRGKSILSRIKPSSFTKQRFISGELYSAVKESNM